jgi:Asp/Glu/hydantoin racemase
MGVVMAELLVLVHTVPPLIDLFQRLAAELLPGVRVLHVLDEPLLERVRLRGSLAAGDSLRLLTHVQEAAQIGAAAVLVTCSTISPCVDDIRRRAEVPLLRIDEAMIAAAVQAGRRIGVIATNRTTLEPTRQLLLAAASQQGRAIAVEMCMVEGALPALLNGDGAAHDLLVGTAMMDLAQRVDVMVLAQASTARVLACLEPGTLGVPVLSSPHLALRAAAALLNVRTDEIRS